MMPFLSKLNQCQCCPRCCDTNRLSGEAGFCGVTSVIAVSHTGLHFGEEPPISGSRGSGTIFFSGCNLNCVFCQNYQISQNFQQNSFLIHTVDSLAREMIRLEDEGAHNINFVSPSHMIFQMADTIISARKMGLKIPIVYNSNGYDSVDALKQIQGLVDVYLPDLKYMETEPADLYSAAGDYPEIVPGVLKEMLRQSGHLSIDKKGVAYKGLLVRHLVLPGLLDNSRRCLDLLVSLDRDIHISLMSQYSPRYRAHQFPEIARKLTNIEYVEIVEYAINLGLSNVFIQDMESSDIYLPDFNGKKPFE